MTATVQTKNQISKLQAAYLPSLPDYLASAIDGWDSRESGPLALSPSDHAAISAYAASVPAALELPSLDDIRRILLRLANNLAFEKRSDKEWAAHLEDFCADLSDIPLAAIHHAAAKWRKTNRFFPKIADIREIAMAETNATVKRARIGIIAQVFAERQPFSLSERLSAYDEANRRMDAFGLPMKMA